MTSIEKKNKRKGIIGTILFHSLVLILFYFIGLSYQDPPPEEEGININFGMSNNGMGEIEPENTEEAPEKIEETVKERITNTEKSITQTEIETTNITQTEKEEEEEEEEEEEPEINTRAIYTGKKKNQSKSEGKEYNIENQGSKEGEQNNNTGIGDNGSAYQLGGRNAINKPKPKGNQIEGRVVVIITVDRLGNVVYANAGAQGSTTLNKELLKRAKIAALKTKFDTKKDAPQNQNGKIIYDFSLN